MKKKTLTPELMADRLDRVLGEKLRSVILYGSAAADDFVAGRSDFNLLVVLTRLGLEELNALVEPVADWMKEGNPAPLCFTWERLRRAADVFPLELLDLQERRRVLRGEDCVAEVEVSLVNLRHQLEYELRSKLLQLRERYLLEAGRSKATVELMISSLSTFLVLFRGVLRLLGQPVEGTKVEAADRLGKYLHVPVEVYRVVDDLKRGKRSAGTVEAQQLFQQYLTGIETVVDKVDALSGDIGFKAITSTT